ncbi:MAG: polymorphic toxin type 4 domain-containing protein [Bryobacteraceae bacterium]
MSSFPTTGERTWRDAFGGIVIQSKVGAPPGRLGFENQFFRGVELGLVGWERAHSQSNITGHESARGIRYAPRELNQEFQRLGIEAFIRELFEAAAPDVELFLTTVTYTHSGTLRLKEIQYRLDARRRGAVHTLFEASLEVEDKKQLPRITASVTTRTARSTWERVLL